MGSRCAYRVRNRFMSYAGIAAMLIMLSACAATPPSVLDNGVERAMTAAEQQAQPIIAEKSSLQELYKANGAKIQTELSNDGSTLKIDATVSLARADSLSMFAFEPMEVNDELGKGVFFGDLADDTVRMINSEGAVSWVLKGTHPEETFSNFARYEWNDGAPVGRISFAFHDSIPNAYQKDFPMPKISIKDEKDAEQALLGLLHNFNVPYVTILDTSTTDECISLFFLPKYTLFPIVPDKATINAWPTIMGDATYSQQGLLQVNWQNPSIPGKMIPVDSLISIDQALAIAEMNLGTMLHPRPDKAIDEVSLRHIYSYADAASQFYARPVWYFDMPGDPPFEAEDGARFVLKDGDVPVAYTDYTESFAIDAISGAVTVVSTSSLANKAQSFS